METLKDFLWPIIAIGGLGAFIDFVIGKAGQVKAKDFLLKWWVRFDDVRWNNFGREEGLFAGQLIERWFGKRVWSLRRIAVGLALLNSLLVVQYLKFWISQRHSRWFLDLFGWNLLSSMAIVSFVGFCISVSFTKFVAVRMAYMCGNGKVKNLIIFLTMLIVNYLTLVFWLPVATLMTNVIVQIWFVLTDSSLPPSSRLIDWNFIIFLIANFLPEVSFDILHPKILVEIFSAQTSIDLFAIRTLSAFPSLFRFILSIIFVGSFLLKPFVMSPVNLVWRRIVESDKPVFTLTFGGAAAFATAISEAAKHLWG